MALTNDQQAAYHATIQKLYGGVVYSTPSMITNSVASVVNTILDEAIECSKAFVITEELIGYLYPVGTFAGLTRDLVESALSVLETGSR